MDVALQLLFEPVDPFHGIQSFEGRVLHGILNVRQCVEGEELGCDRECGTFGVQVRFEVPLLDFELLLCATAEVLVIIRMVNVHDEVDSQVELELLSHEVSFEHLLRK